mmetsp:Transcript_3197/g.5659  ORF Transcript_3197/g.5659 Transcript_3197/m.5659 type:complete len:202 (+) Transcript_3197:653-1258(+)
MQTRSGHLVFREKQGRRGIGVGRSMVLVVLVNMGMNTRLLRPFVDCDQIQGKTFDPRHNRWLVGIHSRDLDHDPPAVIAVIRTMLVVLWMRSWTWIHNDAIGTRIRIELRIPIRIARGRHRSGKKETDSQQIHHGQTSSRGSMNPGSGRKIDGIGTNACTSTSGTCTSIVVAPAAPQFRIQRFEVRLETEFPGTARQTDSF